MWIFALFLLVPIIEIYGFIVIGSMIGVWATLGIVILTAIAGSILLRHQGMTVLFRGQSMLAEGKLPVDEMVDGIALAFAGALLLTPGFFTDITGFLLFIPAFRRFAVKGLFKKFILPNATVFTSDGMFGEQSQKRSPYRDDGQGPIIDGEFEESKPAGTNKDTNKNGPGLISPSKD